MKGLKGLLLEAWIMFCYVIAMALSLAVYAFMVVACHFFWMNGMGNIGIFFGFTTFGGAPLDIHVYNYAIWTLPAVPIVWISLGFALWAPPPFWRVLVCYFGVIVLVWLLGGMAWRGTLEPVQAMNIGIGIVLIGGYFVSRFFILSPVKSGKIQLERSV